MFFYGRGLESVQSVLL